MPAVQLTAETASISCTQCSSKILTGARYCSHCGALATNLKVYPEPHLSSSQAAPSFAPLSYRFITGATQKLKTEAHKLTLQLVRERLFLYLHCLLFLAMNLFGLSLAIKCYVDYIGDEVTKLVMATTPLLFINCLSFLCMLPIRGTRREITRLQEKIKYVKFQIEYNHLL